MRGLAVRTCFCLAWEQGIGRFVLLLALRRFLFPVHDKLYVDDRDNYPMSMNPGKPKSRCQ
jgi:hypothetical protein